MRLLREAQRESNQSSARVSLAGSRRDSPRSSPKSPPNSPVQGTQIVMDWQSYYINPESRDVSLFDVVRLDTHKLKFRKNGPMLDNICKH